MLSNDPPPDLKAWCTGTPMKVGVPFPEGKLVSAKGQFMGWDGSVWHKMVGRKEAATSRLPLHSRRASW